MDDPHRYIDVDTTPDDLDKPPLKYADGSTMGETIATWFADGRPGEADVPDLPPSPAD